MSSEPSQRHLAPASTESPHQAAVRHLRRVDRQLRMVIDQHGECGLRHRGARFEVVARSILSQQISVAAAATIRQQLMAQLPGRRLTAVGLIRLSDEQYQAAGVSRQKRGYLRDLAEHTLNRTVSFRRLARLDDEQAIQELTQVKGIGRWTAQIFLIFGAGRPDVFAPDDLGLRTAMSRLYGLNDPDESRLLKIAEPWRPWRSVASWYLWRSLDNHPATR